MSDRSAWLALTDDALLRQCAVDTYRASGPGGQKRNKTSSAVRLRHEPSGLIVIAEESRSQHENKARALKRLRIALALQVRRPPPGGAIETDFSRLARPPLIAAHFADRGGPRISARHADYWPLMALLLDALHEAGGEVRRAADRLGLGTSQLSSAITGEDKVLAEANRIRRGAGLRPLTR